MASSRKKTDTYHSLRRRITDKAEVMGPQQTEEDGAEIIEMLVHDAQSSDDGKDWIDSDEHNESAVMLQPGTNKDSSVTVEENEEGFWLITFQVFFPFLIAGLGMVGAGLVLDIVQVSFIIFFSYENNCYL